MFPTRSRVDSAAPPSLPAGERRDYPFLDGLNAAQRDAVLTTEGPVLVLAGAGTGKTSALTARLAYIVAERLAWPSQILAVTFTNKAAREMRERIARLIGPASEGMAWLGTFHAIAAKMLRRHAELVGLQANFTILDPDDQLRVIKQILSAEGVDDKRWPARQFAGLLDRWKNRGSGPDDLKAGDDDGYAHGKGQAIYRLYQDRLRTLNACDFGDLLLHMLTIFRAHRGVLEEYQERFRYILVDEYQDTNAAQYLWLRLLAQGRRNIAVVGDDDQSIYSWRGAEVANILRFEKDFPGAKTVRLEQNYRSTPHILGAASGLIAHNGERLGKTLWTEAEAGEKVRVVGVWDGPEEARRIGEEIEALERQRIPHDACAILVRAGFQTREFEERFIQIGMPYRVVGGFRFYERAEVRDAIAYLRLVNQPADDLAFERIVNQPKRGLGDKAIANLHRLARGAGVPLLGAAAMIADSDEGTPQARRALGGFAASIARWRDMASTLRHPQLAQLILDESGYTAMLKADRSAESAGRLENLAELVRAMDEYDTLADFLDHVSLVMDNEGEADEPKVTIMTVHAAKGLEFPHLFLAGWEDGLFPSQRALDEGGLKSLEEERRLAYVAITRARERCTILHAANRRVYGQWQSAIPSRFIAELPEEHVVNETTMAGGESLWRANWSAQADPFSHLGRGTGRGPGWQRAATGNFQTTEPRLVEARGSAVSLGNPGRKDLAIGMRVFHDKFGYGTIGDIEGNKLLVQFESGGEKRLLDTFVTIA
ncbi:MAG: UvrD-helicase domain-containing protein [Sphingopyxis sp.]|nr:UvrD-helicase domain-containing protein [Sphingopyxis sp.]